MLSKVKVFVPVSVEDELPENGGLKRVLHNDGAATRYFHPDKHISEQWSTNPYGTDICFPEIWLKEQEMYCFSKEELKEFATDFFRWWYNQKGTNTDEGFDDYINQLIK